VHQILLASESANNLTQNPENAYLFCSLKINRRKCNLSSKLQSTGTHLWFEQYSRNTKRLFMLPAI